jgi:hypothetical protein
MCRASRSTDSGQISCQVFAEPTCLPAGRRRGERQELALSLSKERGTEQEVWDQSVGLFAPAIEEAGIPTLMLSATLDITAPV